MKRGALVLLLAGLLAGLLWFATQRGARPDPDATIPLRDTNHPVLLIVDAPAIEKSRPGNERERWYDLEWVNVLTQGYGGCDVATVAAAADQLEGRQLVVVPRRTAAALPAQLLQDLAARVPTGMHVLVEAPDSALCRRIGLELATVERRPRLPWPEPVASGARRQLTLRPQPVDVAWTRLRYAPGAAAPEDRPRVHLSLDGRPMGWTLSRGDGAWLALAVDFAELASRLRQPGKEGPLLEGQDHAWLDAWIEGICGSAMTTLPMARIATAPPAADGWLVRTPPPMAAHPIADRAGWTCGTGVPARELGPSGRLVPGWELPTALYAGPAAGLEPARLDRWARHNAAGGAGAIRLELHDEPGADLARAIAQLPERRTHAEATGGGLLEWWEARQQVRVRVEETGETVDYLIEAIPEASPGFGLLVPVRWRNRSLAGWDADWGIAPGRRVQRFDRAYRLVELPPESAGGRLQLRYR